MTTNGAPRWFSENPSKAWGEKFFLAYSPVWMTMMGLVMGLGVTQRVGEWGFMAIGIAVALPLVVVPALIRDERQLGRRWYQTYWFKANLYIAIFNFAANYFGSEYFFDILGMVYDYPMIELNLDATLVGSGEQCPVLVLVVAYFWAWMETKAMANPWIADQFYYQDMDRMLSYGSLFYSLYFIASFPIFYHLDEDRNANWSLTMTAAAALSASMIMMFLLDFAAAIWGALT
jgi:cycloeucalenol cycloisomerase